MTLGKFGRIGLAISLPAFVAATVGARAADIVYPIDDPVYTPAPMALIGDLNFGIGFTSWNYDGDIVQVLDDDDDDTEFDVLGEGRVNIPIRDGTMQLQLDMGAYGMIYDGYGFGRASFQGHLWHKRDNLAYGLFTGLSVPPFGAVGYTIGAEFEHYYGNTTLGAYASYTFGSVSGWNPSAFHVAGYVEHYVTPDHKIGLEIDYASFEDYYDSKWGIALSGEKRVTGTPFSYWVEAGYENWDYARGPGEEHGWGAKAGVRIALGGTPGMTLQEHDRYLPWENVSQLPFFWD